VNPGVAGYYVTRRIFRLKFHLRVVDLPFQIERGAYNRLEILLSFSKTFRKCPPRKPSTYSNAARLSILKATIVFVV